MDFLYDPAVCDLCGSTEADVLVHLKTGRAMRSDRRVVNYDLAKLTCSLCGLVRADVRYEGESLRHYYTDEYTLSTQPVEHYFYTAAGPVSRSAMFAGWLSSAFGVHHWQQAKRVLEVGAGQGLLLREFAQRYPNTSFEGLELNAGAAEIAQGNGLNVRQGALPEWDSDGYDIIYAIAVIEHVPSPTDFLTEIRKRLRPGGLLYLCQPTQDVESYDVFFTDHLHHFSSEHLRGYAKKCGYQELGLVVGHPWMPNFSLHQWQAAAQPDSFAWYGPPAPTTCAATAERVVGDMQQLDAHLAQFRAEDRKAAAFGLNEVYWLARAYSSLGDYPLAYGLDDTPTKPEYAQFSFPVVTPEQGAANGVTDVLLTMNKIYYRQAAERLERLGLTAYPILR